MAGPVFIPNQPASVVVTLRVTYQRDTNGLKWECTHMTKAMVHAIIEAAREWVLSQHPIGFAEPAERNVCLTVQCELGVEPAVDAPWGMGKDFVLAMLEDTKNGATKYFDHRAKGIEAATAIGEEQFDFAKWYRAGEIKKGLVKPA